MGGSSLLHLLHSETGWEPDGVDVFLCTTQSNDFSNGLRQIITSASNGDTPVMSHKRTQFPAQHNRKHPRPMESFGVESKGWKFNIFGTETEDPLIVFPWFHSTLSMNYLAHDHIMIPYAFHTSRKISIITRNCVGCIPVKLVLKEQAINVAVLHVSAATLEPCPLQLECLHEVR